MYAAPEVQLEMIRGMAQRFARLHVRIAELERQWQAAQLVIDAAKNAVDFQPEEGSDEDYRHAKALWAQLYDAVRKVQP